MPVYETTPDTCERTRITRFSTDEPLTQGARVYIHGGIHQVETLFDNRVRFSIPGPFVAAFDAEYAAS